MKLYKSNLLHILNEADYDMGDDFNNSSLEDYGAQDQQTGDQNQQSQDAPQAQTTQEQQPQNTQPQQDPNQQQQQNPDQQPQENDQAQNTEDDEQSDYMENSDLSIDDMDDTREPELELDILRNLSDSEYKINNIRCYRNMEKLYNTVGDTSDTIISSIVTKNKGQRIVLNKIKDNLDRLLVDMNDYIMYRFGRSYENNMIAYIAFYKRFSIALDVAKSIVKENVTPEEEKKSD